MYIDKCIFQMTKRLPHAYIHIYLCTEGSLRLWGINTFITCNRFCQKSRETPGAAPPVFRAVLSYF